jgi:Mg2+-importing ATPase
VQARLARDGPNEIAASKPPGKARRLLGVSRNPLVLLLAVLASVSLATGDIRAAVVIAIMIVLGVTLQFVQETRADTAAERLRKMIHVTATAVRDGVAREVPLSEIVPGDVVQLAAGDMVPGDVRLIASNSLFVNQATLTGESLPVEKTEMLDEPAISGGATADSLLGARNLCYLGTSAQSGTATAVVVETGPRTYLGMMARTMVDVEPPTAFDRGVSSFTWLMIRLILVMVPLVFLINGATKHDWREAFFFALAVAVGLTPEMLPMIVSVCLSEGALAMSGKKVIVRRLDSIQNLGAMDVLCTDKTGTLTRDEVILEHHCDVEGAESDRVLLLASLVSQLQTGLRNVLDRAILEYGRVHSELIPREMERYNKVSEIPFDFTRKLMSVVVDGPDGVRLLIAKGAPDEIFSRCTRFELNGEKFATDPGFAADLREEYDALSKDGFRVLAVAYREIAPAREYIRDDEHDLVLCGYVAFLDPPKESARAAIKALQHGGITVKTLTGDNELVTKTVCRHVGIAATHVLLGAEIERMSDAELAKTAETTSIFARLSPSHKERIIRALQAGGHVVGFLGDGINDAPALRTADVGISVDSAVDVAKAAADIILLEKSLLVLEQGVMEGRKVFSNVLKYVRMGASSNFGNMLSVIGASAWLPFLPMAPIQVLTNNLLYDVSQVAIPADSVDPEQTARPRPWSIGEIRRYIMAIGPVSSVFDYTTFFVMYYVFGASTPAHGALFRTGWFVESLVTQTLIIHVIRTDKIPFLQSRASPGLIATSVVVIAIGVWLPVSPLGPTLGFVRLPTLYWPILLATVIAYMGLAQMVKVLLLRRKWI